MKVLAFRVLRQSPGFYFCDDSLPKDNTQGNCYSNSAEATTAAIQTGKRIEEQEGIEFIGVTGPDVCKSTADCFDCPVIERCPSGYGNRD